MSLSNPKIIEAFLDLIVNEDASANARTKSGALIIKGRTLYSYGDHFPLATLARFGVLAVNMTKYSQTTSKVRNMVIRAANQRGFQIVAA